MKKFMLFILGLGAVLCTAYIILIVNFFNLLSSMETVPTSAETSVKTSASNRECAIMRY